MAASAEPLFRCRVDHRFKASAPLVRRVASEKGWAVDMVKDSLRDFNLWWGKCRLPQPIADSLRFPVQRFNHFSTSQVLSKKNLLAQSVSRIKKLYGSPGPVIPRTYLYPEDKDLLPTSTDTVWICKPSDSSRGRGIFLTRDLKCLDDAEAVVQEYLTRPMLARGFKFDLRLYVLVTSFRPLRVYLFEDAIARLCCRPYDPSRSLSPEGLNDVLQHLTNASLNKKAPEAQDTHQGLGAGCKFLWRDLAPQLGDTGMQPQKLWQRLKTLVIYTCLAAVEHVRHEPACFDLYGFDLMLDEDGEPWVIEVNFNPDMVIEGPVDETVKPRLISALIDTLAIPSVAPEGPLPRYTDAPVPGSGLELIFPYDEETATLSEQCALSGDDLGTAVAAIAHLLQNQWAELSH